MKEKSKNILKWVWFGALGAVVLLVIGDTIFTNTPIGVQLFSGSGGKTVESAKEALKKPEIITTTKKKQRLFRMVLKQ